MKKKLLIFHPALAPYRIDFFNSLADHFDCSFYFTNANLLDQQFNQERLQSQCNFKFNLLDKGISVGGRAMRFGVKQVLNSEKPDVVICSEYSQITLTILALKFITGQKYKVYTISDDSVDLSIERKGVRRLLRNKVSRYIDAIIFPSESVCSWYRQNVSDKTKLLSLPIIHDNKQFRKKLTSSLSITKDYVQNYRLENKRVFLFVGRLVAIKNADFLIKAFAKAIKRKKNSVLVIVGSGEEEARLKKLAEDLGINEQCLFPGRFEGEDLFAWYNIADCFVLPSYQEPYGVVVNEALLAGCTVLCSIKAGSSDLINEENGSLFNPFKIEDLSSQIGDVIENCYPEQKGIGLRPDLMPLTLEVKTKKIQEFIVNNTN
ncbi:glycosyltransferase family 4 protein [Zobellia roscoffensis]|uniref:glycosyltransferase family 4 protein n=1 Tax=Zobellia roscoffensis TaxID=2779508 RepID=UPI00188B466E|nr:glycosyltransferase family 4 protein [Zobellia roscoffensis]